MLVVTFERSIFVRKKVYVSTPVDLSLKDNRFGINKSTHLDLSIGASFFPPFFRGLEMDVFVSYQVNGSFCTIFHMTFGKGTF